MRPSTPALLLLYACLSSVRLLYLPHALPVLDDWATLELFDQACAGGLAGIVSYLHGLVDNTHVGNFRVFWASGLPVFALFFAAGASGWPYSLLAWTCHLLSAVLLCRLVTQLADDAEAGFLSGALFAVFPACNNVMFWSLATAFHYLQVLAFAAWFYGTWRKLARGDFRYRATDFALLLLVAFTGEQILAPLLLLLPLAWWLVSSKEDRPRLLRYWLVHAAALVLLLAGYTLLVNNQRIGTNISVRYDTVHPWTLRHWNTQLLGALGLVPAFAGWRPNWHFDLPLLAVPALGMAGFAWGLKQTETLPGSRRSGELLLWSVAGAALAYLPLARLASPAPRHLYVLSFFLVPAGVALLTLIARPFRLTLASCLLIWSIGYTGFEIRQCWIPQSRVAHAMLDALAKEQPFRAGEIVVLSGGPLAAGPAPAFINGASWSLRGVLARYTSAADVTGARDLVAAEDGTLALFQGDDYIPFPRDSFGRLRILALGPDSLIVSRPVVALPEPATGYRLVPLRSFAGPEPPPAGSLHFADLSQLPYFEQIYFASRISSHDLPARVLQGR